MIFPMINDVADQILYLIISWSGSEDDFMNNSNTNKYRSNLLSYVQGALLLFIMLNIYSEVTFKFAIFMLIIEISCRYYR